MAAGPNRRTSTSVPAKNTSKASNPLRSWPILLRPCYGNRYSTRSALYDDYRYNWYAGYTIAFVTKAVAGAQATKVVKSSKYTETVTEFAKSTRAGKTAMRVKDPYDRGKARVATGLANGGKKAAGPLLQRAKSAGATYRLWKLQQTADVDVRDLSETEPSAREVLPLQLRRSPPN